MTGRAETDGARRQLEEAKTLGAKAYGAGAFIVPAWDRELSAMIEGRKVGETPPDEAPTEALFKAWSRGWMGAKHEADRAATVEGSDAEAVASTATHWIVLFRTGASRSPDAPEVYCVMADDETHAAEQLQDAEPDAEVVFVVQTANPDIAFERYYSGPGMDDGYDDAEDGADDDETPSPEPQGPGA